MKFNKYFYISILIIVIIVGIILVFTFTNRKVEQKPAQFSKQEGKYFDKDKNLLEMCTIEFVASQNGYGGIYTYKFYDLKGNLLGSCWEYGGPGSSGYKGGCDENALKNNVGEIIQGEGAGINAGRTILKYRCE